MVPKKVKMGYRKTGQRAWYPNSRNRSGKTRYMLYRRGKKNGFKRAYATRHRFDMMNYKKGRR